MITAWRLLDISNDDFIRTTEPRHYRAVEKLLQACHDAGDIELGTYEGQYCVACEAYYTEAELVEGNCPIHDRPVDTVTEENYFFKLSRFEQRLLDWYEAHPDVITPETRRNEVLGFIRQVRTVEIKFADFLEPGLQFLQVDIVFFKFRIGEMVGLGFLGNLGFEVLTFAEKLDILFVAVSLEASNYLVFLCLVQSNGFEKDRLARHFGDLILDHFEATGVVVGSGQQTNAVLKVDGSHALEPTPKGDSLLGGFCGDFICEQQPVLSFHGTNIM